MDVVVVEPGFETKVVGSMGNVVVVEVAVADKSAEGEGIWENAKGDDNKSISKEIRLINVDKYKKINKKESQLIKSKPLKALTLG